MKLKGGDVNVVSGVAFHGKGTPTAMVRLTVADNTGSSTELWMRPAEARKIGLDLISAAHASIADVVMRRVAMEHGIDGDELIGALRRASDEFLP